MIACHPRIQLFVILIFLFLPGGAQQVKRPPLLGIAFVELQTADLKKSSLFYTSLLGYTIKKDPAGTDQQVHSFSVSINGRQSVKMKDGLPVGQDERLLSLAFQTTDVDSMRLYLQSKEIKVPAEVRTEKNGDRWFSITDPDGHTIKFIQYAATARIQPQMQQGPVSSRILHAGISIASATAADKFYAAVLGFSEIWRGGSTDSVTSWINMRLPESTDYVEYMLLTGPVNRQQLGAMHHIALMVPDMQQALDLLNSRARGTQYDVAAPRIGRNKRWQLNLYDPDGTRIELMEPFPMR